MAELLVASTVLAAAGALLAGGLLWANRSAETRATQAQLTQLLASQLSRLEETLATDEPQEGPLDPMEGAMWTQTSEPVAGAEDVLRRVTLTVTQQGRSASLVTYRPLAQPEPPDEP